MKLLSNTDLTLPAVRALGRIKIRYVSQLLNMTGKKIREKLPTHYYAINKWVIDFHKMKPPIRTDSIKKIAEYVPRDAPKDTCFQWAKLSEHEVLTIRKLHGKGAKEIDLMKEFSVTRTTIHNIVHNNSWKYLLA